MTTPQDRSEPRRGSLPLLLQDIETRAGQGGAVLAAIDGRCASGKSTLAQHLAERCGWSVIHMDDFFLRPEQRTPARYAAPGENVDHERFLSEVLLPLQQGTLRAYRRFDCGSLRLTDPVPFRPARVVLIEGSYSCHPALWEHYDLHVFLTVDPEEQLRRILARNGAAGAQAFRERWIPLEERYFSAFSVEERCEYVLELTEEL